MARPLLSLILVGSASSLPARALAQHEAHTARHADHAQPGALGIPMTREGSGTAWLPDESPMRAVHFQAGSWRLMLHGNVFAGYDRQGGDVGDAFLSVNWLMVMASH